MTAARGHVAAGVAIALAFAGLSCKPPDGTPSDPRRAAIAADSVTVALWRFDESAGLRCADAGPFRLDATAGPGTRASYGRYAGAREFTRDIDSFVYASYNPVLDPTSGFTIEAWLLPKTFGQYELTPIATRWSQEGNEQSWLFGIVGAGRLGELSQVAGSVSGHLVFAFQPADASPVRTFTSTQRLVLERWTHVAVSFDGMVVRFFISGRPEAQYATKGRIQASHAPLLIGNYFDTRRLTRFSGELRMEPGGAPKSYYAFEGLIDELRISNAARTEFPWAGQW